MASFRSLLLFLVLLTQSNADLDQSEAETTVEIPQNCNSLDDGYYFLKLLDDSDDNSYPIIYAQCSNEYVIINPDLDSDWEYYFSSWTKWHYSIAGSIKNDHSNWVNWFLPAYSKKTKKHGRFVVSPTCSTCDESSSHQINDDLSAYHMSSLAFGCFNAVRGWPLCNTDYYTYECKTCTWDDDGYQITSLIRPDTLTREDITTSQPYETDVTNTGVCHFEIRGATDDFAQSYTKCSVERSSTHTEFYSWKPSLGLDGRYCQCYKPQKKKSSTVTVNINDLNMKREIFEKTDYAYIASFNDLADNSELEGYRELTRLQAMSKAELDRELSAYDIDALIDNIDDVVNKESEVKNADIIELYQTDFEHGTYRITESGDYKIMEDIVFDFNGAPVDEESPNNVDDNYWWPNEDDSDIYPGAGGVRDQYFLGFFAGITIETNDVVLDLNGFELKMSRQYFYQQPFFSIIEFANQPFLPGQGPGYFGSDPKFASQIVIKNGILGLSSHHGIHGNLNTEITISNLRVKNFQTHGIHFNGFSYVKMKDVDVGPSVSTAFLNANYGQMRLLLPTLNTISAKYPNKEIAFGGKTQRTSTMPEMVEKLVSMLDLAFKYVVYGTTDEDNEYWSDALEYFINPTGLPYGAVIYGINLNYPSASIFGWHVSDESSYYADLENVNVHGLRHSGEEVVALSLATRAVCNAFNGPLNVYDMFGDKQVTKLGAAFLDSSDDDVVHAHYKGSFITDVHIAMFYFGQNDWDNFAGIAFMGTGGNIVDWAQGLKPRWLSSDKDWTFMCNGDGMFHPSKGLLGMKISGIDTVNLKNVRVYDLQDETPLGNEICGAVEKPLHGLYHPGQQIPYQVGFSMNQVMGINVDWSNAHLEDVYVDNLYSKTGLVYGIPLWFESSIELDGQIEISNLRAGVDVDDDAYYYDDIPNKAAEVCAIRTFDTDDYAITFIEGDGLDIRQYCLSGNVGCKGTLKTSNMKEVLTANDEGVSDCYGDDDIPFEIAPTEDLDVAYIYKLRLMEDGVPMMNDMGMIDLEVVEAKQIVGLNKGNQDGSDINYVYIFGISIVTAVLFGLFKVWEWKQHKQTMLVSDESVNRPLLNDGNYGSI